MSGKSSSLRVITLVLALSASAHVGLAQTCLGRPSLAVSRVNIGLGGQFTDGVKGFGADLTFGNATAFLLAGATRVTIDDTDLGATSIDALAGLTITPSTSSSLQICPVVGGGVGIGPDFTFDDGFDLYDVTTRSVAVNGGLALGGVVSLSPGLSVVPHVSGGIQYLRVTLSDGFDDVSDSDTGGFVGGGLSLLFSEVFAIRTAVSVPVGFDSQDPTFTVGFSVGLRR
jgi:hypothetical protein